MDLFDDLPEPEVTKVSEVTNVSVTRTTAISLYDDLLKEEEDLTSDKEQQQHNVKVANIMKDNDLKRKADESNNIDEPPVRQSRLKPSVKFKLQGFVSVRKGERDEMQDAHVLYEDCTDLFTDLHPSIFRVAIFAVYDGHGGERASSFAAENLHKFLQEKFPKGDIEQVEREIKKTLIETFKKTDDEFLKLATKSKPVWKDGTTATVLLVLNDTAYIASLGDSQAYLFREKDHETVVPVHLSTVHDPSTYDERIRIQKCGGHVKNGRVMGILEVSRSIGDGQLKKHGVTCLPDVKRCQLTDGDKYIVIACDGLWKSLTPNACMQLIDKTSKDGSIQGTSTKSANELQCEAACSKLANEAVLRLSADNVTVILISLSKS